MERYIYKKQGDGRDSWLDTETNQMVYDDPKKPVVPNVDVVALLQSMSPEQLEAVKQLLK